MRRAHHADLVAVLVAGLAAAPAYAGQQGAAGPADEGIPAATGVKTSATVPPEFAGLWDYNHVESINILTGRSEQAPRSATQGGRAAGRLAGGGVGAGDGRAAGTGFGGGRGGGGGNVSGVGPTPEMLREQRDMSRDLLEVPESYTISVAGDVVVFVDDLERERSYALDGRKQRYRLGASEFTARVSWNGTQLRKDIEGALGFKMSETYFLSPDATRLFVIVRTGQPGRNRQPVGFNRVYDRVERATATDRVVSR